MVVNMVALLTFNVNQTELYMNTNPGIDEILTENR